MELRSSMGYRKLGVRIPPAQVLEILERLFSLKKFHWGVGVDGFPKERRSRYRLVSNV